MSNTKLTPEQKSELKMLREMAKVDGAVIATFGDRSVIVSKIVDTVMQFSISVCSPEEQKFRVKVGMYHALSRFYAAQFAIMSIDDFDTMVGFVGSMDMD